MRHAAANPDEDARRREQVVLAEQYDRALMEILSPLQLERLKQLAIQSQGVFVFREPEIVDAIEITPEQRAAIRTIVHDTLAKLFPPRDHRRGQGDFRWRPPNPELMDEAVARVVKLFNTDQIRRWHELTGPIYPGAGTLRFRKPPPRKSPDRSAAESNARPDGSDARPDGPRPDARARKRRTEEP
jgi:hypothetical protein